MTGRKKKGAGSVQQDDGGGRGEDAGDRDRPEVAAKDTSESPVDGSPSEPDGGRGSEQMALDDHEPGEPANNVESAPRTLRTLAAEEVLAMIRDLPVERSHAGRLQLRWVDLSGTNLAGADLRYVDFEGSVFNGANLARPT